jgi:hypothetical protein
MSEQDENAVPTAEYPETEEIVEAVSPSTEQVETPEATAPTQIAQPAAPVAAAPSATPAPSAPNPWEKDWSKPAKQTEAPAEAKGQADPWEKSWQEPEKKAAPKEEDAGKKWAEEHPVLGRVASALHGAGELIPGREKLSAGLHALTEGGPGDFSEKYERAKRAQERAGKALSEAYPMTHFAGSIAPMLTPVGAEAMLAGEGALARGAGKLLPSLSPSAKTMAGISGFGGAYGAAQGAAEGDTAEERLKGALTGAGIGAAMGPVGAGIGKIGRSIFGPAGKTATQEAAERLEPYGLGPVPRYVSSEAPVQQMAAGTLKAIPGIGQVMEGAHKNLTDSLGEALTSVSGRPTATPHIIGENVEESFKNWIGPKARSAMNKIYGTADKYINAGNLNDLPAVKAFKERELNRLATMGKKTSPALAQLDDILKLDKTQGGVTYHGIRDTKRFISDLINDSDRLGQAGINKNELRGIEKALIQDTEAAAANSAEKGFSAAQAKAAHNQAEKLAGEVLERKGQLANIIGSKSRSDEGIISKLYNMSLNGSGADFTALDAARRSMKPAEWQNVRGEIIHMMGKMGAGDKPFSPANFLTQFNKMPQHTRDVVFGPKGSPYRQHIDDIATMAQSIGETGAYVNTSKTAHVTHALDMLKKIAIPSAAVIGGYEQAKEGEYGALAGELTMGGLLAAALSSPRGAYSLSNYLKHATPASAKSFVDEVSKIAGRAPKATRYGLQAKMADNMGKREERASGGKVGNRDYPAKRLTRMEKALKRAQDAMSLETKSLMQIPDAQIAQALQVAKDK